MATKNTTSAETTDLADSLATVTELERKTQQLEEQLAAERARAETARLAVERQKQEAMRRWAAQVIAEADNEQLDAGVTAKRLKAQFEQSVGGKIEDVYAVWCVYAAAVVERWRQADRRHRAHEILRDLDYNKVPVRPRLSFADDLEAALDAMVRDQLAAAEDANRKEIAAVAAGDR